MPSERSSEQTPDPFALLGLERRFDIDPAALKRAWLTKAAKAHPDRVGASGTETDASSARLNQAMQTLENPERRAGALLKLLGGAAAEDDKSLPDGFLMEMLEVREEAEAAARAHDEAKLRAFESWANDQRSAMIGQVGKMFVSVGDRADGEALGAIRTQLNALRYIERMIDQIGE